MDKKKILIVAGMIVLGLVAWSLFKGDDSARSEDYVFDNNTYNLPVKDVAESRRMVSFEDADVNRYFADGQVNSYTLNFFNFLQKKFAEFEKVGDHLEAVRQYLRSVMSPEEAEKMFELYRKYVDYQLALTQETQNWKNPQTPADIIDFLRKTQKFRRDFFGQELADALFGADLKSREYQVRRREIMKDDDLYADEKKRRMQDLNDDMWGRDASDLDSYITPYVRYQETLDLYKRDLSEMKDGDKSSKIDEIRNEIFPADVVEDLKKVDAQMAAEEKLEQDYRVAEERIRRDPNLTREQKTAAINDLQNSMFGEEGAASFRRLEEMRTDLEKMQSGAKK